MKYRVSVLALDPAPGGESIRHEAARGDLEFTVPTGRDLYGIGFEPDSFYTSVHVTDGRSLDRFAFRRVAAIGATVAARPPTLRTISASRPGLPGSVSCSEIRVTRATRIRRNRGPSRARRSAEI